MLTRDRIEEILKQSEVLMEGHFIYTSGRHGSQYMQCAKILQYPQYAEELACHLVEQYEGINVDVVIGPATGGIILAYEMARQLNARNLFAEREEGKMALRRGFYLPPDAKVLVAEDVVTTGGTVQEVIDLVNDWGGCVVGVAILVNRSMGVVDFGVPLKAAYTVDHREGFRTWTPEECPLCKEGKLPAVKPGSRVRG
jgi:orotate phosphoribosyltransferase